MFFKLFSGILMLTIPLSLTFSILFTQLQHPLFMGLILLVQTVLISLTVGISTYSFWFSYILFLVFLGGMLILFIYMSSLASNEVFMQLYFFIWFLSLSLLLSILLVMFDPFFISSNFLASSISSFKASLISTPHTISWIYNTPSMVFTTFIISYLLLALIVVVKITNLFKGPLRLTSYDNTNT
uniref:NADH-ubiquinone oxidoreductase chain 6 n=1 Tax=Mictyris longicarpus TaxID=516892 RepID=A0A090MJZ4_9EUCA|nr:NADH dehydrogenase subunit 6 [Mictyris longicarpus]CEG06224.1 NADH dehydrogenase subunit 6 [Mictyris longicarpus]